MSLFTELKRRNVFRMAALYVAAAWVIMQVAEVMAGLVALPEWAGPALLVLLAMGFPICLVLSWFYEITPEGILPDEVAAEHGGAARATSRALDFVVIAVLAAAVLLFAYDKWWLRDAATPVGYANSVAVLAFDDLSPEGDQGWFSDGLSEEIINSLAQLPELKVTARTSAFHFKGLDLPIPQIAATLGVAHVVEGSVRRAGERMRVTAQLIKAEDGFHLWSETYDRSTDDVFAVQEDIATNIATALDIYLDEERREEMIQIGTRNVQAYEAYLCGRRIYNEWHDYVGEGGSIWEAQRWFERALEYDPEFAQAHFDHGDAYLHFSWVRTSPPPDAHPGLTPEVALELLLQDYDRAIEFADTEELRVFYRAERTLFSDDWSGFHSLLERLRTIRETTKSPLLMRFNQSDTAFALLGRAGIESNYRHFKRSLERNPLDGSLGFAVARGAVGVGLYSEVKKFIEQGENNFKEDNGYARYLLLMQTGHYDEYLKNTDARTPRNSMTDGWKALALVLAGQRDGARALIDALLEEPGLPDSIELCMAVKMLGDTERAAELFGAYDSWPVRSNFIFTLYIYNWGGRLTWDLKWTPNYAARLAEMGVELEPYEFPPPADQQ